MSVVEGTDSLEKGMGLVPWCVPLAKRGKDGEERKQSGMGAAEAGCGPCFTAAVVQPDGWSMVGRCRVTSLTLLPPRAVVPMLHYGSLQHSEPSPGPSTSHRLNFTMIISNPKDRRRPEVHPRCPSAF